MEPRYLKEITESDLTVRFIMKMISDKQIQVLKRNYLIFKSISQMQIKDISEGKKSSIIDYCEELSEKICLPAFTIYRIYYKIIRNFR